jgi:adenylosuccinate synthase
VNAHPLRVIGLTGLPSSGKGEATRILKELAAERGWRTAQLIFSDQIKEELRRRGVAESRIDREMLSRVGAEMREAEGPGVLAERIAARIRSWPEPVPELFIVDGVRHPGEIEALRRAFGARFVLAAVEAEPGEIARRLIARGRADESREALRSEEDARRVLERELLGKVSALGPNVGECARLADACLPNHGTLDDLRARVRAFLEALG